MGYKFFAKMSERAYLYAPPLRTFWGVIPPAKKQRIAQQYSLPGAASSQRPARDSLFAEGNCKRACEAST
jgi:hypothetical protein